MLGITASVQPAFAQDDDDDNYNSAEMQKELAKEANITQEEARAIALMRVAGTVTESELDKEKGKVIWEFEIKTDKGKSFGVAVDAKTGEIVLVKDETDEDDGDDGTDGASSSLWQKSTRGPKTVAPRIVGIF